MSINNNTILDYQSQVKKILIKTQQKKGMNKAVVDWLYSEGLQTKAYNIEHCADYIGITNINDVAHIVKADFCRNRICNVCAWRRQSKFLAQMFPLLEKIGNKYEFLFATLTIKNVSVENLDTTIDLLMRGYDKLLKRRKIKRNWVGKIRALEITYNSATRTFHPHIHIFVAVNRDYFKDSDAYISQNELSEYWRESIQAEYVPICHIEKVDENQRGAVEVLKYTFKTSVDPTALHGYYYSLRNRRLVSFSGVFAEMRRILKQSDFENILTDDVAIEEGKKIFYCLYKFDASGGVYNYYESLELNC